jgi:hypothetical protein
MNRTIIAAALAAVALPLAVSPAGAASQITNGSGQLTGATGVTVGAGTYDVEFVEGSCSAVFGGCDGLSDFTFQNQTDAQAAAQALLDQVLTGTFDNDYTMTFGCSTNGSAACDVLVPFGFDVLQVLAQAAKNVNGPADDTNTLIDADTVFFDTSFNDQFVWARFTPVAGAVPEPSSWLMLLLGFAGIASAMRRKRSPALA